MVNRLVDVCRRKDGMESRRIIISIDNSARIVTDVVFFNNQSVCMLFPSITRFMVFLRMKEQKNAKSIDMVAFFFFLSSLSLLLLFLFIIRARLPRLVEFD